VGVAYARLRNVDASNAAEVDQAFEDLHIRMTVYSLAIGHARALQRQLVALEQIDPEACNFCGAFLVPVNIKGFERATPVDAFIIAAHPNSPFR
jgi:hypothetical protein